MSHRRYLTALTLILLCCSLAFADEILGETSSDTQAEPEAPARTERRSRESFGLGSIYLNAGVFYGSALFGGEADFGLARFLGILVGGGFFGANAGFTFHVFSRKHIDLFLAATGDYFPALSTVVPDLSFNVRGFFGRGARVGVCGKIGIAIITVNRSLYGLEYRAGNPMLTYAIGVPIKIKK